MPLPRIILFGDSISAWSFNSVGEKGFGDRLVKEFDSHAEVENEGYPGGTTKTLRKTYDRIIADITSEPERPVLLFTILLGANDSTLSFASVPIAEYEANIKYFVDQILISKIKALEKTRIVVFTPTPIDCTDPLSWPTPDQNLDAGELEELEETAREGIGFRTWTSKRRYAERIISIVQEYRDAGNDRVVLVDAWKAMMEYGLRRAGREGEEIPTPLDVDSGNKWPGSGLPGSGEFGQAVFRDGLHLGLKGNEILTDVVLPAVNDLDV